MAGSANHSLKKKRMSTCQTLCTSSKHLYGCEEISIRQGCTRHDLGSGTDMGTPTSDTRLEANDI